MRYMKDMSKEKNSNVGGSLVYGTAKTIYALGNMFALIFTLLLPITIMYLFWILLQPNGSGAGSTSSTIGYYLIMFFSELIGGIIHLLF